MRSWSVPPLLAAALWLSLPAYPADWPQFLGPNRDGSLTGVKLAARWPGVGLEKLWQRDVGQGFSAPVVAEGKLILFHRLGAEEVVEALDPATGRTLWKFAYPTGYRDDFGFEEGPRGTPAISQGRVFTHGAEGMLHATGLKDGRLLWQVDTRKEFGFSKGFFGQACSPLVEGGLVHLNVGGPRGAGVVAFRTDTGKVAWKATDHEAGYASPVAATLEGKRRILFFTREGLVGVDPADGAVRFEERWRSRSQASVNAASPLVAGSTVFVTASYGTGAITWKATGDRLEKLWASDDSLSSHYASAVHRDGILYGFHGRQEYGQELRAVELATGKVRWSQPGFQAGTVTLIGDQLLVVAESGEAVLALATPAAFQPSARAKLLPPRIRPYPAIADGRLFVRNEKSLAGFRLPVE